MALKCDNCFNDAQYTHADQGVSPAHFCRNCLPPNLYERAQAGHFPVQDPDAKETPVEIPVAKSKSQVRRIAKTADIPEEDVVLETPVDEDN